MPGPTGYSIISYGQMVTCEPRMTAYADALRQAITPGCTVIDIGAGPGIFSLLACQFGAGSVIAIEPDDSVELLRRLAADNDCADRITIVQGLSTDFIPQGKADVIISDIRGCLPLFEGHIRTIADARTRLLAPGGTLIPARDTLRIALCESDEDYASIEQPWAHNPFNLRLEGGRRYAANGWWKTKLQAEALLSEPVDLAVLDYYQVEESDLASSVELLVARSGSAHGLLVWFDAELAPGIGFSNAPGQPPQVYGHVFFPLERAVEVSPGDRFEVEMTASLIDGSYVWGWNCRHFSFGGDQPGFSSRQSTFLAKVLSPQSLRPRDANFVPPSREAHDIDRLCLSLIDGQRSLRQIAYELQAQFPERFTSTSDALNHVASLTARYR